jgi:hypothetical protein
MAGPTKAQQAIAQKNGILADMVPRAAKAAEVTPIPFYVICAFLMQESNGGHNVYGHDVRMVGNVKVPQPFWGHGEVTEANYQAYKRERDALLNVAGYNYRRSQGVGPMQLTYWSIQDRADKVATSGCWHPWVNIATGARIIKEYYDAARKAGKNDAQAWHDAALKYNGKEAYAVQMDARFATWKKLIG